MCLTASMNARSVPTARVFKRLSAAVCKDVAISLSAQICCRDVAVPLAKSCFFLFLFSSDLALRGLIRFD